MSPKPRFAPDVRFAFARVAVLALACACLALALAGCGHEPEIATPPADNGQSAQPEKQQGGKEAAQGGSADSANGDSQAPAADEKDGQGEAAAQEGAAHEGPFVVSILNAGGADGLAGAAQETLAASGIANGDDYAITADSYLAAVLPATAVYVTGAGDDAKAVRAEADKIAQALGCTVASFDEAGLADLSMEDVDILVMVGQDALA